MRIVADVAAESDRIYDAQGDDAAGAGLQYRACRSRIADVELAAVVRAGRQRERCIVLDG